MKTLTPALLTELGLSVTRPGYLVQLGYSSVVRLSTMGDITWAANTWYGANAKLSNVGQNGAGENTATLTLGNTDDGYGALVLSEGASDIAVTVWACYAGATATGDPVQVFSGVTNGADIDTHSVKLDLVAQKSNVLYSPRVFVNAASGFNFLQPAGSKITFGTETFVLERA